jgi:hypothetical protein
MSEAFNQALTELMFDARLEAIDVARQSATFICRGIEYTRRLSYSPSWSPGTMGALRLHPDDEYFDFYTYPDQRLRRAPERDHATWQWWSWVIDDHHFYIRAGIIPGIAGAVVRDECESLEVPLPPEFIAYCRGSDFEPDQLLRAFIADASGIQDSRRCPREDRYCSTGTDQRFLAREYVQLLRRTRPAGAETNEVRRPLADSGP